MLHAVHGERGGLVRGGSGWGGSGQGGLARGVCMGGGQGTFQSSCHILHCHMVLRPKGTSHNHVTQMCCRAVLLAELREQTRGVRGGGDGPLPLI